MEKYYGNYLGIVVSEDGQDPERRNRIQVWVPGITNTMYGGWNDDFTDKKIYYIGDDSQLKHSDIQKLRAVLPWAECASPLIGGGGTSLYYGEGAGANYQSSQQVSYDKNGFIPKEQNGVVPTSEVLPEFGVEENADVINGDVIEVDDVKDGLQAELLPEVITQ
jgi:hypothetical protein